MNRAWKALGIGVAIVCVVMLLGRRHIATPIPFCLLSPGLLAGAATPGSGFVLKEDAPWSPFAIFVAYAVNISIYGGLAYLVLSLIRSPGNVAKEPPSTNQEG
jgi:hypothetical protein